jgi:photoactive yellow protein
MADSEPDLYSFLRSKDLAAPEGEEEADQENHSTNASDDEPEPSETGVQIVDSFEDDESSDADDDASLTFEADNLADVLGTVSEDALDEAPFGVVQIDDDGVVQFYNQYESELSGVDPEDAVGRNFFTQLAPCSGNRLFHGRFKKGIKQGELDERFTYTFTYKMSPTLVDVRMHRDDEGRNWVLIRKR